MGDSDKAKVYSSIALSKRTKEPAQAKKKEQHLPIRHAGRPADMSSG